MHHSAASHQDRYGTQPHPPPPQRPAPPRGPILGPLLPLHPSPQPGASQLKIIPCKCHVRLPFKVLVVAHAFRCWHSIFIRYVCQWHVGMYTQGSMTDLSFDGCQLDTCTYDLAVMSRHKMGNRIHLVCWGYFLPPPLHSSTLTLHSPVALHPPCNCHALTPLYLTLTCMALPALYTLLLCRHPLFRDYAAVPLQHPCPHLQHPCPHPVLPPHAGPCACT